MITILRKNQRVLMLVVAVLTIVAFIWLYNPADTYQLGRGAVATIYGRKVSQADIERQVKTYQLALAMGQFSLLENLGGMTQDEESGSGRIHLEPFRSAPSGSGTRCRADRLANC